MSAEFDRDNRWQAALTKAFLDPLYRSRGWQIERYPGDHPMQRLHVDVLLRRVGGEDLRIDEKLIRGRRDGQKAEKINLETWSSSQPQKVGWIHPDERNECTHLLICFANVADIADNSSTLVQLLDCVWIPFPPLRVWFWAAGEERWELQDNQQSNHSLSRKVPITDIFAAVPGVSRFHIGRPSLNAAKDGFLNGFVGYDANGHFVHYCHCGALALFGAGVNLREDKLGEWRCLQHKGELQK